MEAKSLWKSLNQETLRDSRRMKVLVLILAAIGILLILWSPERRAPEPVSRTAPDSPAPAVEMENNLEGVLASIEGAGAVQVRVTLASEGEAFYATNDRRQTRKTEEKTRNTAEDVVDREVVLSNNAPILVEKKAPAVAGVLVVAEGAVSPEVEERLQNAVCGCLGVPASRVTIMPMDRGR